MSEAVAGMQVEVLYAAHETIWRRQVVLPEGATVAQALEASGVLQSFPEFSNAAPAVGVYGRICAPHQVLHEGDRVEVYRPLIFDPMESRRRRARHRERKQAGKLSRT